MVLGLGVHPAQVCTAVESENLTNNLQFTLLKAVLVSVLD